MRFLISLPEFENSQRMMPEMHELPNLTIVPERKKSQSSTATPKRSNAAVIKYFDALMQSLIFSDREQPGLPYIIAVTSARSGEGVSTVAANLAMRLARLGHGRVLLADMNPMNLDHEEYQGAGTLSCFGQHDCAPGGKRCRRAARGAARQAVSYAIFGSKSYGNRNRGDAERVG